MQAAFIRLLRARINASFRQLHELHKPAPVNPEVGYCTKPNPPKIQPKSRKMADIVADDHKDNRRFDSGQTESEKPNPIQFGNQNGNCSAFDSLSGDRHPPQFSTAVYTRCPAIPDAN
jgi:hypothetical protein